MQELMKSMRQADDEPRACSTTKAPSSAPRCSTPSSPARWRAEGRPGRCDRAPARSADGRHEQRPPPDQHALRRPTPLRAPDKRERIRRAATATPRSRPSARRASPPPSWWRRPRTRPAGARRRSAWPTARTASTCSASRPAADWKGPVARITTTEVRRWPAEEDGAGLSRLRELRRILRRLRAADEDQPALSRRAGAAQTTPSSFAQGLQRAGYATDPAYADKLSRVINTTLRLQRGRDMSGGSLLSIGTRAMFANYAALQTTGHNIANANVEGYSRQQVELATADGPVHRRRLLRQGRGRGDGHARAQRVPDARSGHGTAQAAADAARLSNCSGSKRCSRPANSGLGYAAGSSCSTRWSIWRRSPADALDAPGGAVARAGIGAALTPRPARRSTRCRPAWTQDLQVAVAEVNQPDRSASPQVNEQIARAHGHRPAAERSARPARPTRRRAERAGAGQHAAGRRRHARRVRGRRPAPGAGHGGDDAVGGHRRVRRERTRHRRRRRRPAARVADHAARRR